MNRGSTLTSQDRQKRYHHKVFTGCLTCRSRRVKCDETKPVCKNCLRANRKCAGKGYDLDSSVTNVKVLAPKTESENIVTTSAVQKSSAVVPTSSRPGTFSLLDVLSASHDDPFSSAAIGNVSRTVRQILHHAVMHQWTMFATPTSITDTTIVKRDLMSYALNDIAAYKAMVYAGASHQAFARSRPEDSDHLDPGRLRLKHDVVRALLDAIRQVGTGTIPDELLVAVVVMASHGSGEMVKKEDLGLFRHRRSLIPILDAEYYGALDVGIEHVSALFDLVTRKGGVASIRSPVLRVAILRTDVLFAYREFRAPRLARFESLQQSIALCTWPLDTQARDTAKILGADLPRLLALTGDDQHCKILTDAYNALKMLTIYIDQLHRQQEVDLEQRDLRLIPRTDDLIQLRFVAMWEMLNLPEKSIYMSSLTTLDHQNLLFDLFRVAFFCYNQAWLWYVVSRKGRIPRQILDKALPLLEAATTRSTDCSGSLATRYPDFFVWVVVLCIMLAYEEYYQTGSDNHMLSLVPPLRSTKIMPVIDSWDGVLKIMRGHLWSDLQCDMTGREAWKHFCFLNHNPSG